MGERENGKKGRGGGVIDPQDTRMQRVYSKCDVFFSCRQFNAHWRSN